MTPRRFFYPQVVIEFYHTMTSRRKPHPTALHLSINGRPGILRASDIAATFNLPVVLANSTEYRQCPHPYPRKMVRLLSEDITVGSVLFKRKLPPHMLLIDHILRSNLFPLQHTVQRREAILEAIFRISEGYWFSPTELIMTSLFHFEDKVQLRGLSRAESMPLLFLRLLCQVLEHMGFPDEPRLESRRDSTASLIVDRWWLLPRSISLPTEDHPATDISTEEQPPPVEHFGEPQAPTPSVPASPPPTPTSSAPLPFDFSEPHGPSTTPTDGAAASTSAPPQQHITISTHDFLTIMDAFRTFSTTAASFATANATLADKMTRTEAAMAHTSAILAHNQVILMQIQRHLGLPAISPYVPAQTVPAPPPAEPVPPLPPTPIGSLVILAAVAVATTPPAAPQPAQTEDVSSPATD